MAIRPNSFFVRVDLAKRLKFGNNRELFQRWHWDGDGNFETGSPRGLALGRLSPLSTHRLIVEKREVLPAGLQPRFDTFCFTRDGSTPPDDAEVRTLLGEAAGCSTPTDCDDANACTNDACNTGLGDCGHEDIECDDADPCTIDVCDEAFGCGALTLPDATSCGSPAP